MAFRKIKEPEPADDKFRLVYTEALRGITQQQQALDNLRTRSGILLSAAGISASFLATFAGDKVRCAAVVLMVIIGLLFVTVVVLSLLVLRPQPKKFEFRNDPHKLLTDWVEHEANYSLANIYRNLAYWLGEHYKNNEKTIDRLYAYYAWACLFSGPRLY